MDARHSTSTDTAQQRFPALPNRLGHNGPYFGVEHPVAQDCAKIEGHTDLFRDPDRFESDLTLASERVALLSKAAETMAMAMVETGLDAGEALSRAASDLRLAARYLADAALLAEVLDDRQNQRDQVQDRRDFLAMIAGKPRDAMSATERLSEEAKTNWRIAKLLDRLSEVCGVDRTKAWPFIDTARVDALAAMMTLPSVDEITAMDGEALLDTLHRLEAEAGDRRKRIALIHALRHAQSA